MSNTADQALAWAKTVADSGTTAWNQLCLKFCRTAYGVPAKYPTAKDAWYATKHRGTGTPPRGALVWWTTGSAGHVAIADGTGRCVANYWPAGGKVQFRTIEQVSKSMGSQPAGWSRDINGVLVLPEPPKETELQRLRRIAAARLRKIRNLQARLKEAKAKK